MKKYPRIINIYKYKKNNCAKCRCGEISRYKVDIQYNCMRGNDDVVWACEEHKKDIEYLTANNQLTPQHAHEGKCKWIEDNDNGHYFTECGGDFILNEGTPKNNDMKHCCYCGLPLLESNGT